MTTSAGDQPSPESVVLERSRPRFRPSQIAIVVACFAGLAGLLAAEHSELSKALSALGHAKPGFVAAAIVAEWLSIVGFVRLQRWLLKAGDLRLTVESILAITLAGDALSLSVPLAGAGLGAAFTYREFERRKVLPAAAAFVPAASGVVSTVSLTLIVAGAAIASGNDVAGVLGIVGAALIVVAAFGLVLAMRIPACQRLLERLAVAVVGLYQRVRRKPSESPDLVVARAREGLLNLHLRKRDWLVALVLALVNWLGDAACLALCIKAAGLPVPFDKLLLAWSAGQAAVSLGFTPGGLGVVEVALVGALVGIGLPAAGSTAAVLMYRLISLWLVLLAGWIIFLVIRSTGRRSKAGGLRPGPFVAVARTEITAEEVGEVLGRGLGPRYHVRHVIDERNERGDVHTDPTERIGIRRLLLPMVRAEVAVVRRPEGTFLYVIGGGFSPLTRISNRLFVVRKVRSILRSADEFVEPADGSASGASQPLA